MGEVLDANNPWVYDRDSVSVRPRALLVSWLVATSTPIVKIVACMMYMYFILFVALLLTHAMISWRLGLVWCIFLS
jgi:hypothetical protein